MKAQIKLEHEEIEEILRTHLYKRGFVTQDDAFKFSLSQLEKVSCTIDTETEEP